MPIQPLEQRKRQRLLIFVALGIIIATALVLYFGIWSKSTSMISIIPESATTAIPTVSSGTEEKLRKINLDFKFLNEKIIPFLKIHGEIPVTVDKNKLGRDNPFIPY